MIKIELNDEECPQAIRDFVRNNPDIEIYDYVKRGLNGEVYFGKRIKMGDDVVLKFYWAQKDFDESEEAITLRNIDHSNVLKIWDLKFVPKNFAYFLSPKISGGDLQSFIDSNHISSKEALEIVAGILMGLTELHSKHKLVHRDLKPGNILFDLETKMPIIADLGAVKKVYYTKESVTASKATFYYLPPESVMNDEYYFQSDIYQVGILLFQLLGGKFHLDNPIAWCNSKEKNELEKIKNPQEKIARFDDIITEKIKKGKLIDTNTLPSHIDSSIKKVINRATNFHYEKRYSNTALFLKDIHNLLRAQPDFKILENGELLISHTSGKKFKIFTEAKKKILLEKCVDGKTWRKINKHNGDFAKALEIAKNG